MQAGLWYVAVVTDSISCLSKKLVEQYRITIVSIMLLVQVKIYRDMVDVTSSEAYELFLQDPRSFNTSPASPGHYLEAYREASKQAKNVLCITLSSKLSTGYDMARVAKEHAKDGFRTNAIIPGGIVTPGTKKAAIGIFRLKLDLLKTGLEFRRRLPAGRFGQADEVARMAVVLASDLSSYVHGTAIPVDGGFLSA